MASSKPGSKSVLIIDDNSDANDLLTIYLEHIGLEVLSALSGAAALEIIDKCTKLPSLILTDMTMPGMDGPELVTRLQASAKSEAVPVVVVSGKNGLERDSQLMGVQGFLKKPYRLADLKGTIDKFVS